MKRFFIALVALVMTIGVAGAQVRFGIRAGANFNKLHWDTEANLDPKNSCGWNAGVMAEFTVPIVGLCFDASLLYSRMNNAISHTYSDAESAIIGAALGEDPDMDYGKNFLEVPINIKYKFQIPMVASVFAPYIFTGPSFAFKLDKSIMDRTFQAAWNVGIGVELIRHLQISGSYGFGMNNVAKNIFENNGILGDVAKLKAKNNYWTVSAAWLF